MPDIQQNDINTELVRDLLKEKRAERRWRNLRCFVWIALIAFALYNVFGYMNNTSLSNAVGGKYVALIRLDGTIAPGRDFSSQELIPVLKDALSDKNAQGLIIDINSPGGTPVQASIIHDAILTFKHKYHKKVVIVGEDLLTSGAYFVAVAGDKIYVNPNTLTGSVGVIMKGFGFVDLIKKVGIERRVYTSGNNKDRLDAFLPQNPDDLKKIHEVMSEVHQNFAQAVIEGRKGKLHGDPASLFTGDFWSGSAALKLGLVDGLGNLLDVMTKEFNTDRYKEYDVSNNFFKLIGGQLGSAFDSMVYTYS